MGLKLYRFAVPCDAKEERDFVWKDFVMKMLTLFTFFCAQVLADINLNEEETTSSRLAQNVAY